MSALRRKLSLLLQVAAVLLLAAGILAVAGAALMSSDLSWLPNITLNSKRDEWQARFAARFRRQRDAAAASDDVGPLRCGLRRWNEPPLNDDPAPDLLLELTNISEESVRLWYLSGAECHVTFVVLSEGRSINGSFCYGIRSVLPVGCNPKTHWPEPLPPVLSLHPGETYATGIHLHDLRNGCSGPTTPGVYQVEAVLLYEDIEGFPEAGQRYRARSQPVAIELVGRMQDGRCAWQLRSNPP
jgi:hypothetical protein